LETERNVEGTACGFVGVDESVIGKKVHGCQLNNKSGEWWDRSRLVHNERENLL